MSDKPNKFVGLHAHDGASTYDGLGPPQDHIAWCKENGLDAWSVTNHGHMNSMATAMLHVEKMNKSGGEKFKFIPGAELYLHPSLEEWKLDLEKDRQQKQDAKLAKKERKKQLETLKTTIDISQDENDEIIDMSNSLTIENEEESKKISKFFNPVNRRHHLVVLPKTSNGLLKLFNLVSRGYVEGFYRFPRIDYDMLKEAGKSGELIVSTACLAGTMSWETMRACQEYEFDDLNADLLNNQELLTTVLKKIANVHDRLVDAVGLENAYLELQFNKFGAQHLVNRALIEYARRNNLQSQLIVTCDSHYPRPELWKEREIYKKIGWMNYKTYDPSSIPQSKDELKCELYPKNASQIWDEYQNLKSQNTWYNDQEIKDAIERTHDIAHQVIGDITYDKGYKYPSSIIPKDTTAFKILTELSIKGLKNKGLDKNDVYVKQLKYELEVIKEMDNASYFVTLQKMLDLSREVCLLGVARGSSGGSLVCYLTGITDLDPIKYGCRFDRFLNRHRCLDPEHYVLCENDKLVQLKDLKIGDKVVGPAGDLRKIIHKYEAKHDQIVKINAYNTATSNTLNFICSIDHKWLVGKNTNEILAKNLNLYDELQAVDCNVALVENLEIIDTPDGYNLIDIEVDIDHMFYVSPDDNYDNLVLTHNSGAPDVDVDISHRDKVLDVLRKEFGFNNVVPISNMNLFKTKSLLKDLAKFHGISFQEANEATRTVENDVRRATTKHGDDKNLFVLTYDDAMKYSSSFREFIEKYPAVGEHMKTLFKEQRSLGRHAGGVLVLDDAMKQIPMITSKGEPQTPWCEGVVGKALEPMGLLKFDLLGLETMALIERTIEIMYEKYYGQFIKLEFEDKELEVYENQSILLTNGEYVKIKHLNNKHDVDPSYTIVDPAIERTN